MKDKKILWDQEIGSEIQYLQAKNNKERLEHSLATMRKQLSKKNIYAPISGVVNKEFASAGGSSWTWHTNIGIIG